MEQNSILFRKDGKNFLQLDCENAKELSLSGMIRPIHLQKTEKSEFWNFRFPQL